MIQTSDFIGLGLEQPNFLEALLAVGNERSSVVLINRLFTYSTAFKGELVLTASSQTT